MATISKTFSDVGVSDGLFVKKGDSLTYTVDVSNDFDGVLTLRRTVNGGITYDTVATISADVTSATIENCEGVYSFKVVLGTELTITGTAAVTLADVSEVIQEIKNQFGNTILKIKEDGIEVAGALSVTGASTLTGAVSLSSSLVRTSQKRIINVGAKVGATAGFAVNAGDNLGLLATCPASQTASTLVVPIPGLKVGDTITSFHLVGQIESAGNAVTVDADLRKLTAAAADVTDASVGAIVQLSVTADTIMSSSNTNKASLTEVVAADETFYVLITVTTGASTDVALQGVAITVSEA